MCWLLGINLKSLEESCFPFVDNLRQVLCRGVIKQLPQSFNLGRKIVLNVFKTVIHTKI